MWATTLAGWRNIALALTDLQKSEKKAQACDMACFRQSSLDSHWYANKL
jgi:hypothetical protein